MTANRFAWNLKISTEQDIILVFQEDFKSSTSPHSLTTVYYSSLNKNGVKHKVKNV